MFYHLKSSCRFHIKIVQRIYLSFTSNQVSYCWYLRLLMENVSLAMVPVRRFVILLTWFTLSISTRSGTAQFSRGVSPSWTLPSMGFSKYIRILLLVPDTQPCPPSKLEVFSTLKEVAGYINIQAHHPRFTTLSAFSNLEIVGVRHFWQNTSPLSI